MHWSRDGRSFFLVEESKFPHYLLSRLSVVLNPLSSDDCTTTDSTNPGEHINMSASYEDSLAPYTLAGLGVTII
jgi:hypothetical protein